METAPPTNVEKKVKKKKKEKKEKKPNTNSKKISGSSDVRVQATNDDSIVSKRKDCSRVNSILGSASRCGYFEDESLRFFVDKPSRRSPLINRGYYIRLAAVRYFIEKVLATGKIKQFVEVGAGFDTTFFAFAHKHEGLKYFEVDYSNVVARKAAIVRANAELYNCIQGEIPCAEGIFSSNYSLLSGDLRDPPSLGAALQARGLDWSLPTLFVAECVLTYNSDEDSSRLIQWVAAQTTHSYFLTYEQILPWDTFGHVMKSNLKTRGSPLLGLDAFPDVPSQKQRYLDLGFEEVWVGDMNSFWEHILPRDEAARVQALEPFDEEEEWKCKCAHYFLVCALKGSQLSQLGVPFPTVPERWDIQKTYESEEATSEVSTEYSFRWVFPHSHGKHTLAQRWGHSAVAIGTKIYIWGGYGSGSSGSATHSRLDHLVVLDTTTLQVKVFYTTPHSVGGMGPTPRVFGTATQVENSEKILFFGGRKNPSEAYNDLFQLNTQEMEWVPVSSQDPPPPPRWRHSAAFSNFRLFIFGGKNASQTFNDLWAYNTHTSSWEHWEPSGDLPLPRYSASLTASGEDLYLWGGAHSSFQLFNDLWRLSTHKGPRDCTWERVECSGNIPLPRFSHTTVLWKDHLLVLGGSSPRPRNDSHLFNLKTHRWVPLDQTFQEEIMGLSQQNSKGSQRSQETLSLFSKHCACLVGDRVFVVGGGLLCFSFGSFFSPLRVLLLTPHDSFDISPSSQVLGIESSQDSQASPPPSGSGKKPRKRKLPVEVPRISQPSQEEFSEYLSTLRCPVILTGVPMGPATTLWTPEYLQSRCSEKEVSVHVTHHRRMDFLNKNFQFENMPFPELVRKVFASQEISEENSMEESGVERYYLRSIGVNARKDPSNIQKSFPEISQDFQVPSCVPKASHDSPEFFSSAFRISSKGIQMWTHYDVMDNILCEVKGSKKILLWPPEEVRHLYVSGSTSHVLNVENPDYRRFPKFAKARSMECILQPGEILFIPAFWFHNVLTLEPCIAVNIFFRHLDEHHYEKKDLYGNKDLIVGQKAIKESQQLLSTLSQLPPYYRKFYGHQIIEHLKSKLSLGEGK